jgi:hypothetical protein
MYKPRQTNQRAIEAMLGPLLEHHAAMLSDFRAAGMHDQDIVFAWLRACAIMVMALSPMDANDLVIDTFDRLMTTGRPHVEMVKSRGEMPQ